MMNNIETDRAAFRQHALTSRQEVHKGDSVAANKQIAAAETIAARWGQQGQLVELLEPLLAHPEVPWVRLSAASYLFFQGQTEIAGPALKQLQQERLGLASADAGLILDGWREQDA